MKHVYAALLGAVASVVGGYSISFVANCIGWFSFFEGLWLVQVSLISAILSALALSFILARTHRSRLTALLVAFIAVAVAGSAGAITHHAFRFGLGPRTVIAYCRSSCVYAVVLLPLSYPLTRLLQLLIQRIHATRSV